jgi:hypothetical protein
MYHRDIKPNKIYPISMKNTQTKQKNPFGNSYNSATKGTR